MCRREDRRIIEQLEMRGRELRVRAGELPEPEGEVLVVAAGTSLPEVATSMRCWRRCGTWSGPER